MGNAGTRFSVSRNKEYPPAASTTIADQRGPVVGDGSEGGAQTGCVEKGWDSKRTRVEGECKEMERDHTTGRARNMNERESCQAAGEVRG